MGLPGFGRITRSRRHAAPPSGSGRGRGAGLLAALAACSLALLGAAPALADDLGDSGSPTSNTVMTGEAPAAPTPEPQPTTTEPAAPEPQAPAEAPDTDPGTVPEAPVAEEPAAEPPTVEQPAAEQAAAEEPVAPAAPEAPQPDSPSQEEGGDAGATPAAEPEVSALAAPPGTAVRGPYHSDSDWSSTSGWYWSGSPATASEIHSFTSSVSQVNEDWVLSASWTRPVVGGTQGWVIEYTEAAESWGGRPGDPVAQYVPQPDRSLGGTAIMIGRAPHTATICTYADASEYPNWNSPDPTRCQTFSGAVTTSGTSPQTINLSLALPEEILGEVGCPPTFGSTAYIRSWTGNYNVQAWSAPIAFNPPSTCASLTLTKQLDLGYGASGAPADWTLTATGQDAVAGEVVTGTSPVSSAVVKPGDYVLSESGPDGYELKTDWICTTDQGASVPVDAATHTVSLGELARVSCVIVNQDKPGAVSWTKTDDQTPAALLGGSEWTMVGPGHPSPGTVIADCAEAPCTGIDTDPAAGAFSLGGLAWGDYTVTETKPPTGHAGAAEFTFTVNGSNAGTVIVKGPFANTRLPGAVMWSKVSAETGDLLGGSEWSIVGPAPDTTEVAILDCSAAPCAGPDTNPTAGEFELEGLVWGTYTVTETKAPAGHASGAEFTFTIDASNAGTVLDEGDIENPRLPGTVTWSKVAAEGGDLLEGSEWKLVGPEGPDSEEIGITDCSSEPCTGPDQDPDAGEFELTDLAWGDYRLVETKAPPGYVLDPAEHEFTVSADNLTVSLDPIENEQQPGVALPLTGGMSSDLFTIGGLGIAALAAVAGALYWRRIRRTTTVTA